MSKRWKLTIAIGAFVVADLGVMFAVLALCAAAFYVKSRGSRVGHDNVNDDWTGSVAPAKGEPELVSA